MNSDRRSLLLVPATLKLNEVFARRRLATFASVPVPKDRFLFLGDSITEQGLWDQWLPELPGLNRGIGGNTTQDLLDRLDSAVNQPIGISLLIGTNDLHNKKELRAPAGISARAERLVSELQARAPEAPIFLNSITPRTAWFAPRIRDLNQRYREIASRTGATYVDLWPVMADSSGAIRPELTRDNLHLSPAGYIAWRDTLRPLLSSFRCG